MNRGTHVSPSFGKVEIHQENKVAGAKDRPNDGATPTKSTVYRPVRREKTGTLSSSRLWSWTSCVNKWQLIKQLLQKKQMGRTFMLIDEALLGDPVGSLGGGGR